MTQTSAQLPNVRLPPSIESLRPLLAANDVDRVAAIAMALLTELSALSERVARLEGADPAAAEARTAALVARTLATP